MKKLEGNELKLDRIDKTLLLHMQRDSSLSVNVLAEKVGISKSACWRRIQKFEEANIIQQRLTVLDPVKLGLNLIVFISVRTNQHNRKWAQQFKETVEVIPGIMEVYCIGGDLDYLIKAVVEDITGYDHLYQRLISADLFEVTAGFVMETIKHTHDLPISP